MSIQQYPFINQLNQKPMQRDMNNSRNNHYHSQFQQQLELENIDKYFNDPNFCQSLKHDISKQPNMKGQETSGREKLVTAQQKMQSMQDSIEQQQQKGSYNYKPILQVQNIAENLIQDIRVLNNLKYYFNSILDENKQYSSKLSNHSQLISDKLDDDKKQIQSIKDQISNLKIQINEEQQVQIEQYQPQLSNVVCLLNEKQQELNIEQSIIAYLKEKINKIDNQELSQKQKNIFFLDNEIVDSHLIQECENTKQFITNLEIVKFYSNYSAKSLLEQQYESKVEEIKDQFKEKQQKNVSTVQKNEDNNSKNSDKEQKQNVQSQNNNPTHQFNPQNNNGQNPINKEESNNQQRPQLGYTNVYPNKIKEFNSSANGQQNIKQTNKSSLFSCFQFLYCNPKQNSNYKQYGQNSNSSQTKSSSSQEIQKQNFENQNNNVYNFIPQQKQNKQAQAIYIQPTALANKTNNNYNQCNLDQTEKLSKTHENQDKNFNNKNDQKNEQIINKLDGQEDMNLLQSINSKFNIILKEEGIVNDKVDNNNEYYKNEDLNKLFPHSIPKQFNYEYINYNKQDKYGQTFKQIQNNYMNILKKSQTDLIQINNTFFIQQEKIKQENINEIRQQIYEHNQRKKKIEQNISEQNQKIEEKYKAQMDQLEDLRVNKDRIFYQKKSDLFQITQYLSNTTKKLDHQNQCYETCMEIISNVINLNENLINRLKTENFNDFKIFQDYQQDIYSQQKKLKNIQI